MRPSIRHFISTVHFTVACVGAFPRAEHGALSILLVESVVVSAVGFAIYAVAKVGLRVVVVEYGGLGC